MGAAGRSVVVGMGSEYWRERANGKARLRHFARPRAGSGEQPRVPGFVGAFSKNENRRPEKTGRRFRQNRGERA